MILREKADIRTVLYMVTTTALLLIQWNVTGFTLWLYPAYLFFSVAVAVIAHNHNHLPVWRNRLLNIFTDYWLTLFYGFPAFGWIPTHNLNHHKLNNKEGDYTITYRMSESNNLVTLLTYPSISSYHQQKPIRDYMKRLWNTNRTNFYLAASQYVVLALYYIAVLLLDWQKALLFVVIPHQVALFSILIFNYVQHVHADEESQYDHSRNFVGPMLNTMLFNNGFHTIHHEKAGLHWSKTPEAFKQIQPMIDPALNERSFWGYMIRVYILALFAPKLRTSSKRAARMQHRETTIRKPETTVVSPR